MENRNCVVASKQIAYEKSLGYLVGLKVNSEILGIEHRIDYAGEMRRLDVLRGHSDDFERHGGKFSFTGKIEYLKGVVDNLLVIVDRVCDSSVSGILLTAVDDLSFYIKELEVEKSYANAE